MYARARRISGHLDKVRAVLWIKPERRGKFANEEVQMIVDSLVTSFNENVENGAKLTIEK